MKKGVLIGGILLVLLGCAVSKPRLYEAGGKAEIHRDRTFLWVPYYTDVEKVETPDQVKERLVNEKAEREQEVDLKRDERQENAAFWYGLVCMVFAGVCVVYGCITHGYKFWCGMAFILGGLGAGMWGFSHWLWALKWAVLPVIGIGVFYVMRSSKEFSVGKVVKAVVEKKKPL